MHSHSSSNLQQQSVFPPGKRCSPSAATDTQRSAVPCTWCNVVLAGVLRTEQVTMWWCEVKTVGCMWQQRRPKFVPAPSVLTLVCNLALSWRRNIFISCVSSGTKWTIANVLTSWYLNIEVEVHCCPPRQDVHKNNTILMQRERPSQILVEQCCPTSRTSHHQIITCLVFRRTGKNFRCTAFYSATVAADEEEQLLRHAG